MISLSINVAKIAKEHLRTDKNGNKWLDLALWETPGDKYGNDYRVNQSLGKEARDQGLRGAILGNGKNRGNFTGGASRPAPAPTPATTTTDEVPF